MHGTDLRPGTRPARHLRGGSWLRFGDGRVGLSVKTKHEGRSSNAPRRRPRNVAAAVVVLGALMLGALTQASSAANPTLDVTFSTDGTITFTLPDGTPVGATAGTPPVIPAGYYTLILTGPGGCNELPYFELHGPGENILNDMDLGEMKATAQAYFLPNSTYTWRDNGIPGVVYTFSTSSTVLGAPPAATRLPVKTTPGSTSTSTDIVGSSIAPFRGKLTAVVTAAGRLSLVYKGRSVSRLEAGRYTISVTDRSSTNGVLLKAAKKAVSVTGGSFVGKRSVSVVLTAGRWLVVRRVGVTSYSIVVR